MPKHYDFAGWATVNDILCADGRTIRHGAFSECNGKRVPLVYMHNHNDVKQVLGHAILEEKDKGMYAYCSLNKTSQGQDAKEMIQHGDVIALSIFADELKENRRTGDVIHGNIKEVSLVLAGANKGAIIDSVLSHGDMLDDCAEIRFIGYGDIIIHSDIGDDEDDSLKHGEYTDRAKEEREEMNKKGDGETVADIIETLSEKQKKAVAIIIEQITGENKSKNISHADEGNDQNGDETVEDVYNTLNEKQKKVVAFLVGKAREELKKGGSEEMKHNVFEGATPQTTLSHDDFNQIMKVARQIGTLSTAFEAAIEEGFIQHADIDGTNGIAGVNYGITNIDYLFPDAKVINTTPEYIKRDTSWVDGILSDAHRTPFSRVKSIFANITEDDARARGYIKGKVKKEEVFSLLKRTTDPQTIYKKQKLDKDDIDDITDFNVVTWIKAEMQLMLREEIARAILIGDGRLASSDDKIQESHIRPIYNDADLYTAKVPVVVPANATDEEIADALIKTMIKSRKFYKGSGNPKFYTTDEYITDALLVENKMGERKYKSEAEVATAMRVKSLVAVEVMENQTIEIEEKGVKKNYPLIGIIVNLADYNIGTNGGAKTDFFDDFDLDFNQYKYLYETRMSGALIKPYSAISFYLVEGNAPASTGD